MKKQDLYQAAQNIKPGPHLKERLAANVMSPPERAWPRIVGIAVATCMLFAMIVVSFSVWNAHNNPAPDGGEPESLFLPGAGGEEPEGADEPDAVPTEAEINDDVLPASKPPTSSILSIDWLTETDENNGALYIIGQTYTIRGIHDLSALPKMTTSTFYNGKGIVRGNFSDYSWFDPYQELLEIDGEEIMCTIYMCYFETAWTEPGVYEYNLAYLGEETPPCQIMIP